MRDVTSIKKRIAIRHECIDLDGMVGDHRVKVIDLSLEGLLVEVDSNIALCSSDCPVTIVLKDKRTRDSTKMIAWCVGLTEHDQNNRYHFKFNNSQRPEKLGWLNRHLSKPIACAMSNRDRYERQRTLAESDIATLQDNIQNLKNRQFELILASIPILFGLLASFVAFISSGPKEEVHDFYYVLPPSSIILSFLFLAVFIQKTESIRRASAFTLILQRHLAMGSLPPCYRGWHDAFENYNHFVRHDAERKSPFEVEPFEEKNIKHRIPANSFNMLAVGLLLGVPSAALFLMVYLFYVQVKEGDTGLLSYTTVVIVATFTFFTASVAFYNKYRALTKGKRSFRYLVVLFSKILKYAPPFDPYQNSPLTTHTKPQIKLV